MKAKTFGPKAEVPKLRKHCFCSSTCEMKFSDNVFFMFGFKCWTVHVYMKSNVRHQARWQAVQLLKVRSVCKIKTVEQVQSQATNLLKLTNYIQETLFGIETVGGFASGTRMRCHMHTCIPATSWVAEFLCLIGMTKNCVPSVKNSSFHQKQPFQVRHM